MDAPTLPSEQLRWNVLEHAHNPTDVAFEALPPETLALFEPRGAAAGGEAAVRWPEGEQLPPGHEAIGGPYQQGPMPRFAGDASEICTDPEWREYWSRQGVLDAVCDTAQTMADTMRRLRVPLGQGRAALDDCGRLRPLVVQLYNEKLTLLRSLRVCETERARLRRRVAEITLHLRDVAREIQRAYPADVLRRRGLSVTDEWTHEQWVALYPQLHVSVRRIIDELSECNARLNGDAGLDDEVAALKVRLHQLEGEVLGLRAHMADATARLDQAREIVGRLVRHAAAMGYSLKQIDAAVSPDADEDGVRAFVEGLQRYEFSAPAMPADGDAVDVETVAAQMHQVEADMDALRRPTQHAERYPFPVLDEWYD